MLKAVQIWNHFEQTMAIVTKFGLKWMNKIGVTTESKYRGIKYRGNCDKDVNALDNHSENANVFGFFFNLLAI